MADQRKAPVTHFDEVEHRRELAERANAALTDRLVRFSIENPGASEDITLYFTDRRSAIVKMVAVLIGSTSPSVTWTVRYDADRSATGTEVVSGGTVTTNTTTGDVVDVAELIETNSFVWLETTAQSGTVNELHLTLYLSEVL